MNASPLLVKRSPFTSLVASLDQRPSTILTASQISTLNIKNAVSFAAPAYCRSIGQTKAWNCGPACQAVPNVKVLYGAGNGATIPFVYVGYAPAISTIVVGHAGTNFSLIDSVLIDADFILDDVDGRLKAPAGAKVHNGFTDAWAETADGVLAAVQAALAGPAKSATTVLVTGHSLGGALALLDGLYLKQVLPSTLDVLTIPIALPRVGNPAFASWADDIFGTSQIHIVNENDIVAHLPPNGFYQHPRHEIWQQNSTDTATGNMKFCSQHESDDCSNSLPALGYGLEPHKGPYLGIRIDPSSCR